MSPAGAPAHPGHGPTQVTIANFAFAPQRVEIATGDAVIWFWDGPDANHTVTGPGFESDPGQAPAAVRHRVNDAFSHRFTQPGTFTYVCRVHSFMGGTVVASGDPVPDDVTPPRVGSARVRPSRLAQRGARSRGRVTFTVNEAAKVSARVVPRGGTLRLRELHGVASGDTRRFSLRLSARGLRPGAYDVLIRATDTAGNAAEPKRAPFRVLRSGPTAVTAEANPHKGVRPLSETSWLHRILAARRIAARRHGRIAFAVVDERGRLRAGQSSGVRFHSASLVKAMLLVAYLNDPRVRARDLRASDLDLLDPMVRRSGNRAASRVRDFVGNAALSRLARRARMRGFATAPSWGSTLVTAADQARLFSRIDRLVVRRHRATALRLLRTVIDRQRWGIPAVAPPGTSVAFKGGWRREGAGRLVNQAALVERGRERVAIAILTDGSRSHGYGVGTVERIAAVLLGG